MPSRTACRTSSRCGRLLDGEELALDADGRIRITAGAPGKYDITVTATDADGGTRTITSQLKVRDPADKAAPAVAFTGPVDGALVTGTLPVTGAIDDANLDYWTLELVDTDGEVTELARGEAPIAAALSSIDGRTLPDGFYTLRLTARDIGGRTSVAGARIEVHTGTAKTGRFETQRTDVTTTLGGVPFALTRAYDSLTGEWSFLGLDLGDRDQRRRPGGSRRRPARVRARHPPLPHAAERRARRIHLRAGHPGDRRPDLLPPRLGPPTPPTAGRSSPPTYSCARSAPASTMSTAASPTTPLRRCSAATITASPGRTARHT